jgi:glycosyltransferase involved in cell wall biosynthesis
VKILNVNMSIDPVKGGGTAVRTVQMSKALAKVGHTCSILTLNLGINNLDPAELHGVDLTILPCVSRRFYLPWPRLSQISALVKNADIIHLMGHWTILNGLVYYYIRAYNKKYVVCPAGALPLFGRSKLLKRIYNYFLGKRIIQNSDSQIVITKEEISHFSAYGLNTDKIVWIPNGIEPETLKIRDDASFRKKYNLGNYPFILFIGRLNPIKGPDLLVEAFCMLKKDFPNHHLVLAGPDEGMLASLQKTIAAYDMNDRVHFIGHISGEVKSQGLHAATLMAIPSRQEAMSIVVLEAGVTALPVLLTDRCGLNYLEEIDSGMIVPSTIEGIKKGLVSLLPNEEKMNSLGENLQHHILENYLWSTIVVNLTNLYKNILKN